MPASDSTDITFSGSDNSVFFSCLSFIELQLSKKFDCKGEQCVQPTFPLLASDYNHYVWMIRSAIIAGIVEADEELLFKSIQYLERYIVKEKQVSLPSHKEVEKAIEYVSDFGYATGAYRSCHSLFDGAAKQSCDTYYAHMALARAYYYHWLISGSKVSLAKARNFGVYGRDGFLPGGKVPSLSFFRHLRDVYADDLLAMAIDNVRITADTLSVTKDAALTKDLQFLEKILSRLTSRYRRMHYFSYSLWEEYHLFSVSARGLDGALLEKKYLSIFLSEAYAAYASATAAYFKSDKRQFVSSWRKLVAALRRVEKYDKDCFFEHKFRVIALYYELEAMAKALEVRAEEREFLQKRIDKINVGDFFGRQGLQGLLVENRRQTLSN